VLAAQAFKQSSSEAAVVESVADAPPVPPKAAPWYLAYRYPELPTQVASAGQFDPVVIFWPG
jgi:hypothetical protein